MSVTAGGETGGDAQKFSFSGRSFATMFGLFLAGQTFPIVLFKLHVLTQYAATSLLILAAIITALFAGIRFSRRYLEAALAYFVAEILSRALAEVLKTTHTYYRITQAIEITAALFALSALFFLVGSLSARNSYSRRLTKKVQAVLPEVNIKVALAPYRSARRWTLLELSATIVFFISWKSLVGFDNSGGTRISILFMASIIALVYLQNSKRRVLATDGQTIFTFRLDPFSLGPGALLSRQPLAHDFTLEQGFVYDELKTGNDKWEVHRLERTQAKQLVELANSSGAVAVDDSGMQETIAQAPQDEVADASPRSSVGQDPIVTPSRSKRRVIQKIFAALLIAFLAVLWLFPSGFGPRSLSHRAGDIHVSAMFPYVATLVPADPKNPNWSVYRTPQHPYVYAILYTPLPTSALPTDAASADQLFREMLNGFSKGQLLSSNNETTSGTFTSEFETKTKRSDGRVVYEKIHMQIRNNFFVTTTVAGFNRSYPLYDKFVSSVTIH